MAKSRPSTTGSRRGGSPSVGDVERFFRDENGQLRHLSGEEKMSLAERGLNASMLQQFVDERGLYGKPNVVSDEELDAMIADGAIEMYRGMPDSPRTSGEYKLRQVMEQDKYYIGHGTYGDGTYVSQSKGIAAEYAVGAYRGGVRGSVARAVLNRGARYIEYQDLVDDYHSRYPRPYDSGEIAAYAIAKGYDAISMYDSSGGYSTFVVLNRNAVTFGSTLGSARNLGRDKRTGLPITRVDTGGRW